MGAMMGWTIFVGSGGGMLLVGGWELHRRLHRRDLDAVADRQRIFAEGKALVWGSAAVAALALGTLIVLAIGRFKEKQPLTGMGRLIMAFVILGVVFAAAASIAVSASRNAKPRRRRSPPRRKDERH